MTIDPITIDVIANALKALIHEMDAAIERTAMSIIIREQHDFGMSLVDDRGWVIAGTAFGRLRTRVAKLGRTPSDDKLHATRILAKKARYAADVAVPVVGKPAAKLAKALGKLQDVLGDLHDCAVAEAWLTRAQKRVAKAWLAEQGIDDG